MPFDPNKDLQPISVLVSLNNVLVVNPSVKINSVNELIALAKEQPGKLNYASSGSGTSIHMSGEMFKFMVNVNLIHVPYKGSAPAVTDLLGGQVMMMFDNIPSSMPHIKSGKLRAIATTGAKRDPSLPDLPTIAEAGVPGYEAGVWFGLMAPLATPKEIVAKLNAEIVKASKTPEYVGIASVNSVLSCCRLTGSIVSCNTERHDGLLSRGMPPKMAFLFFWQAINGG
jgi:tripartite-type tricarboxylate transporter receptor subunit TctC